MGQNDVFIIASEADFHSSATRWALRTAGIKAEIISGTKFWHKHFGDSRISISNGGSDAIWMNGPKRGGTTIWPRKQYRIKEDEGGSKVDARYISNESFEYERNMLEWMLIDKNIFWVNRVLNVRAAELKTLQLASAARQGLSVPDTLVTSSPKIIREFADLHGKVVVKPFNPHIWVDRRDKKHWMTFASYVDKDVILNCDDEELSLAPVIYQKYIPTISDIRVAVIGGKLFALEMRHSIPDEIDFRGIAAEDLEFRPLNLPEPEHVSLLALMDEFDLAVASADFVMDDQGNFTFIELNPTGAFLFLEERCPTLRPLAAISSLLAFGSVVDNANSIFPGISTFANCPDHTNWVCEKQKLDAALSINANITDIHI